MDSSSVLPHRYPLLLLDRITAVQPGRSADAYRLLTRDDPWIDGHGRFPPTLLAEILAQCAGVAAASGGHLGGVLAKVDRFRVRSDAIVGGTLSVHAQICRVFGTTVKARGVVRLDGRLWAAAEVVLQLLAPRSSR